MATVRLVETPAELHGRDPGHCACVVIDLIRASSTIAWALGAGARAIVPVVEVEEARREASRGGALLAGERGGIRVEGFDLGNSPGEFTPERVGNRRIVLTTTNGTRAIRAASGAPCVLIGSLANLGATAGAAAHEGRDVWLVCAGVDGSVAREDVLCAGALGEQLAERGLDVDEPTRRAIEAFRAASESAAGLLGALRESEGGRNLIEVGLEADLEDVVRIDSVSVVASFDREAGEIVAG